MGGQPIDEASHEHARLSALRRYALLDTPPERHFDALTRLAAQIFSCPYATITLIDSNRQWFKAHHGLDLEWTPRDIAFCDHTVRRKAPFIVSDALAAPLFRGNPLVEDSPFIRFYAGCPLITPDEHAIGSFAIFDVEPRGEFSDAEVQKLWEFAALAIDAIELRHHRMIGDLLRSVVIHTNDGVMITRPCRDRPDGAEIVYVNAAFGRLMNYDPGSLTCRYTGIFHGPNTDENAADAAFAKLEAGESFAAEFSFYGGDGRERIIEATGAPVKDESGRACHWVSIWRDVTERRAIEDSLAAAKAHAEHASQAKSWFLANMSHELRTPINAIIGYSEMMLSGALGPAGAEKQKDYLENILEAGRSLLSSIEDVLDVVSMETGRHAIEPETVNWAATVSDALNLLAPQLLQSKTVVERQDAEDDIHVRGDPRALKKVLVNIVENAAKFSPPDSRVRICSRYLPDGGLCVVVDDRGIGMSEDEIDLALQPFEQLSKGYGKSHGGMGIGLPIASHLVKLHDGELTIESHKGKGTTVTVSLPPQLVSVSPAVTPSDRRSP